MLYSEQPTFFLARRHLNTMTLTSFENLNSISIIFQETHNFLVLTDSIIIYADRHFLDQENVRHPTSKLLKYDFAQILSTFRNPSLGFFFVARKASLALICYICNFLNLKGWGFDFLCPLHRNFIRLLWICFLVEEKTFPKYSYLQFLLTIHSYHSS